MIDLMNKSKNEGIYLGVNEATKKGMSRSSFKFRFILNDKAFYK